MKKIVICIGVAVLIAVAAVNVNLNTSKGTLSELALANIEALAQSETNNKPGRYRTISCDCQRFDCMKNHCCYNEYYSNCPANVVGCSGIVYGCND